MKENELPNTYYGDIKYKWRTELRDFNGLLGISLRSCSKNIGRELNVTCSVQAFICHFSQLSTNNHLFFMEIKSTTSNHKHIVNTVACENVCSKVVSRMPTDGIIRTVSWSQRISNLISDSLWSRITVKDMEVCFQISRTQIFIITTKSGLQLEVLLYCIIWKPLEIEGKNWSWQLLNIQFVITRF